MRTIAISDIHGNYDDFRSLLKLVNYGYQDRLIILGDMIDRGPDSAKVVSYIRSIQTHNENVVVLQGNHEQMVRMGFLEQDREWQRDAYNNGAGATLESYGIKHWTEIKDNKQFFDDMEWFKTLPLKYQDDQLGIRFVHAGVRPKYSWDCQIEDDLLWIRESWFLYHKTFDGKCKDDDKAWRYVFGHTPVENLWNAFNKKQMKLTKEQYDNFKYQIWHSGQMTCIDCGKAYGNKLAALVFNGDNEEQEFYV